MTISKINFGAENYDNYQVKNPNKKNVGLLEQEHFDEEKSNAVKLMIGASALAGIVALGIAGYKGKLGKNIQKLFKQSEKAVEEKVSGAAESASKTQHNPSPKNVDTVPEKTPDVSGVKPETAEVSTPRTNEPSEPKIPEKTTDTPEVKSHETPKSNELPKDDIPEVLRGIEGERQGNKIIQDLEDGKLKIYEFVPGKNSYSVMEKNINTGSYQTTYFREDGLVEKVGGWEPEEGSASRTFGYDELKRKTSIKEERNGGVVSTTNYIYEGDTTCLKQVKITETGQKLPGADGVSVIDYRNGRRVKETRYAPDGKTVKYYTTFQDAPYGGVNQFNPGSMSTVKVDVVEKSYVEFHDGTKNKYIERERDPFGRIILYRKYAKDGKTLTYEEVIKDGRKSVKGKLLNEYDLNH